MDPAELDHAEALARAGNVAAALEYERVGDARSSRGDELGALAAYVAAIVFGSTHGLDIASKGRIEDKRTAIEQQFTDWKQVLGAAVHTLGTHPASSPGHRALCPGCGAMKTAVWLPCPECRTPHRPGSDAAQLLLSERVRSFEELAELGAAMRAGESHDVPEELARVVDSLLSPLSEGVEFPSGERVPGTIVTARDLPGKTAVILSVGTTSDEGSSRTEFKELAECAARALLVADAHPDDLSDEEGQSIRERRRQVERRLGERIEFERWRRISVERGGCIGTAEIPFAIPVGRGTPRRAKLAGNRVGAVVVLGAGDAGAPLVALLPVADQMAKNDVARVRVLALLAFAGQMAMHAAWKQTDRSFYAARYLSVADAIEVMSSVIGCRLELATVERFERPLIDAHDPDTFPSEAAKRA